jgi:hypothetical protein
MIGTRVGSGGNEVGSGTDSIGEGVGFDPGLGAGSDPVTGEYDGSIREGVGAGRDPETGCGEGQSV